jgi:hypothetical protein
MSKWSAGLVAAVVLGVVGAGCGGVEVEEEQEQEQPSSALEEYLQEEEFLVEAAEGDGGNNMCGSRRCFTLERDKNISHIFLDFGKCADKMKKFRVLLTTPSKGTVDVTGRLKTQGGPCKELDADYRFEVPGPDRVAKVCVVFHDYISDVRVGAKAANDCRYERGSAPKKCTKCEKKER